MIEFKNVCFSFKEKKIFEDLTFKINDGETLCVLGASGSGKSTLLRLIVGLEAPQKGVIKTENCENISAVFQENRLLDFLSAKDNVNLFCDNENEISECFKRLSLENDMDLKPDKLSGGMKRRVAVIRAVCHPFDLLILDEPFTGLDEDMKLKTADLIKEKAAGKTVVISTHDKNEALYLDGNCKFLNI